MSDNTYFMNDLNGDVNFKQISFSIDGGKTYKKITQAIADNCVITNKKLNGKILLKSSDKDINGELRDGVLYVNGKPAKYLTSTGETKTVTLQDDRAIEFSNMDSVDTTIALNINNIDVLPSDSIPEVSSSILTGDISLSTNGVSHIKTSASRSNAPDAALMRAVMGNTSYFYVGKNVGDNGFLKDVTMLCLCLEKDLFDYDPSTKTGLDASNKFTVVSNYIHNTLRISDGKNEFNSYKIIQLPLDLSAIVSTTDRQHIVFIVVIDHAFPKLTQTINIEFDVLSCKYSSIENTYLTVTDKNNDVTILRNCGYHLTSNDSSNNKLSIDVSTDGAEVFPQYTCVISNGDNVSINNSKINTNEKYVICNSTFNTKEYNVFNKNEGETSFYKYNKLRACMDLSSDTIGTINNVFTCPAPDMYSCPQKLTNDQYSISQDTTKELASLVNPKLQQPIIFHLNSGDVSDISDINYDVTLRNSKIIENKDKFNESPLCLYLNYEFEFYDRNNKSYTADSEGVPVDPFLLLDTSYDDTDNLPKWNRWGWGEDDIPLEHGTLDNKYLIHPNPGVDIKDGDPVMLVIDGSVLAVENITATDTNSYQIPYTEEYNVLGVYPTEEDAEAGTNIYNYKLTQGLYTTISLVGVDILPESVWVKYRKSTKESLYEFVHIESDSSGLWVDRPSSVQETDTVSIYASLVIKSVKATLATFLLPKQEHKNISNAFVYDTGNENYVSFGEMEWSEAPSLLNYKSEFGGFWLDPNGISIENIDGSYYLRSGKSEDIKIHAIQLTNGKEFIFRNEKQEDSSFNSLTKKYPCIPYKSNREFNEIEYEPWTKYCVNTGKKITITDPNIDENFVWVEYKKELLNTQDRIFKCIPINSKENKDVYSISFDFRNLAMPFGESAGSEEQESTVDTFKLKDLNLMFGSIVFINNNTPEMSEDTYNRFLNIYSVDQWNDFYDLVHSHTYIDFNTILLKMMTQPEDAYAHVILNMTTDSEQFYTRDMVNDSSHSDAIEISDDNTAKFLNMALEYRFDPNEETPLEPVENWCLKSGQIIGQSEVEKYILKFKVTDITDEELESFINSILVISGRMSETIPSTGSIALADGTGKYTALFDASGYDSLYPVEQESNLIKSGTTIGHIKYKMFNSDGETPVETPQALGGSSRTFNSILTKITA